MRSRRGTESRQRTIQCGVRLTPDEYARLEAVAKRDRVTVQDVLRRAIPAKVASL